MGAFTQAPLPSDMLVVARPPASWVRLGLVGEGELWTLHRAVYGLRVSPRLWGLERDRKLRSLTWSAEGKHYRLQQSTSDSQVWTVRSKDSSTPHGLVLVYVDDFLLLTKAGACRAELKNALRATWEIGPETELTPKTPIASIGLELEREADGGLYIHQKTLCKQLLARHGLDSMSKAVTAVQVGLPEGERQPTPTELRQLQAHAGELNWLSTRTRPDISYVTSVLASAATKFPDWSFVLAKRVLRYLLGTYEQGLRYPKAGSERELVTWSDAGFGGASTRSQSGTVLARGGAIVQWRSSRQHNSALSTCEADVAVAALAFQVTEGLQLLPEEWGITVGPPILRVDNKSATTVTEHGGTWRTRYFAVRAARIGEEVRSKRLSLRYCRTDAMVADGLAKLVTALLLDKLREAMDGRLPPIPGIEQTVPHCEQT